MSRIVVIGAGWAGLHCAYELTKAGHQVKIIEAAPQIGGRARGVTFADHIVDNGQHIAIGAYQTMRALLQELGVAEHELFKILPLEIRSLGPNKMCLRLPQLPRPLNIITGVMRAKNMPWSAKLQMLHLAKTLHRQGFILNQDCSVLCFLKAYHQSNFVIEHVWQPIALAAMSTPIETASAQVFVNILQQIFSQTDFSHWYLPATNLSVIPNLMAKYLLGHNQEIVCNQAIKEISIRDGQCKAIVSNHGQWSADHFVLAIPPTRAADLLHIHPIFNSLSRSLRKFKYEIITTIYYRFAKPLNLPYPMWGLRNGKCHWIFDRGFANQPEILSAVITGALQDTGCNEQLAHDILNEISQHFLDLKSPTAYKVIREKRAAFSCDVDTQKLRPSPQTAVANLWLCGDYLQTGLPATLEGALLSGKQTCLELLRRC